MITIQVTFKESEIERMVKDAGFKVADKDMFKKIIGSAKFAKELSRDIKQVWQDNNEDSDMYCVIDGFGLMKCVEELE